MSSVFFFFLISNVEHALSGYLIQHSFESTIELRSSQQSSSSWANSTWVSLEWFVEQTLGLTSSQPKNSRALYPNRSLFLVVPTITLDIWRFLSSITRYDMSSQHQFMTSFVKLFFFSESFLTLCWDFFLYFQLSILNMLTKCHFAIFSQPLAYFGTCWFCNLW